MFKRLILLLLTGMFCCVMLACAQEQPVSEESGFDLEDCPVIYGGSAEQQVITAATTVKNQLRQRLSKEVTAASDETAPVQREILIGETNRPESTAALAKLPKDAAHAYILEFTGDKLVIAGSDAEATVIGAQYFVNFLLSDLQQTTLDIKEGYSYMDTYDHEILWATAQTGFEQLLNTTVYGPTQEISSVELTYSRIIELSHSGEQNGTLLATAETLNVNQYIIHRSTDGGKTWQAVGKVQENAKNTYSNWQPMLYELPCAVGDMPAGTVLLAGCIRNSDTTYTAMTIFRSNDCGENWEKVSVVAEGGGFDPNGGLSTGLWEPFLLCDESGTLYCFYSDETDAAKHSQMIVCRSSSDGIHWSETQRIVACEQQSLRPGMPTVTRMGNGQYFIAYEMVGMTDNPVYFKTTADLSDWGDAADLGTPVQTSKKEGIGSAPYCCWISAGGESGTLIVTAKNTSGASRSETGSDWMVSFNYGKSWTAVDNPLPYTPTDQFRYAYSPCIFASSDGETLYYVNNINSEIVSSKAKMQLAVLRICGFGRAEE